MEQKRSLYNQLADSNSATAAVAETIISTPYGLAGRLRESLNRQESINKPTITARSNIRRSGGNAVSDHDGFQVSNHVPRDSTADSGYLPWGPVFVYSVVADIAVISACARQVAGGTPVARLNARLKAASDS